MKTYITLLIIIISFSACTKRDKRKVVDTKEKVSEVKKETNSIDLADLPIYIDSTDYLIHPIGNYIIRNSRSEKYSGDSFYYSNYTVSNYNGYRIAGDLSNVKFQHVNSEELKSLTNAVLKIHEMSFLFEQFKKSKKGYYVYDIIDQDTNNDGLLDKQDLKSLYISQADGSSFRKLTPQLQDLTHWKLITANNRLYFKSVEDTNNDGEFNKKDQVHYFYLNLDEKASKVVEYYPI
jgi:hypothetical protein